MTTAMHEPSLMSARPRVDWLRLGRTAALWSGALLLAMALDGPAYAHLNIQDGLTRQVIESSDWYRLLRVLGSLWTWCGLALVLMLIDRSRVGSGAVIRGGWPRRGVVLALSAFLSGLAAEGLKGLVGRLRPESSEGAYVFMPLAERMQWNWSDLGMPSSHAAVAFGAAMALSFKYRAAAPVFLLAAAGCGMTRVVFGQHFLSDVLVAAWIAYAVSLAIWRLDARNNGGVGLGEPGTGVDGEPALGGGRPARGSAAP